MSIKYTDCAKRIINNAKKIATELGSNHIGTVDLLLAIFEEGNGIALQVLERQHVKVEDIISLYHIGTNIDNKEIKPSPKYLEVLSNAEEFAKENKLEEIGSEHILYGILKQVDSETISILQEIGFDFTKAYKDLSDFITENTSYEDLNESIIKKFGVNLNELVSVNKIQKVIGREEELERVIEILSRKGKNNPCLTGEAGVGKTALVEGLAYKIYKNEVPSIIKNKQIISINLSSIVAGTKYRGEFEERIKALIEEAVSNPDIILFFDEIHTLIGTGGTEGSLDAANILKPVLARGDIQIIGATTAQEYRKYILKDQALERRFQEVYLEEPSASATIEILKGIKPYYENYHKVSISDKQIELIVELSQRYINGRFMPDKAIDVLDESCSRENLKCNKNSDKDEADDVEQALKSGNIKQYISLKEQSGDTTLKKAKNKLSKETILEVVSKMSKVPISILEASKNDIAKELSSKMKEIVIGQDEAIDRMSNSIKRAMIGLNDPHKPLGSFLLVGPTGSGKTLACKALAKNVFGGEDALIRFDMSEYSESHTVSKLIGSPPGYVGYGEGGLLTESVHKRPYSVVLFDEIEKAHPDLYNMLLQIMDEGILTDTLGRKVSFKNTIVVMSSNAGAKELFSSKSIGFNTLESDISYDKEKSQIMNELNKKFAPEFLNRLDDVLVFKKLKYEDLEKITRIEIEKLNEEQKNIEIIIEDSLIEKIAKDSEKAGFGARPVNRNITQFIKDPLAEFIINSKNSEVRAYKMSWDGEKTLVSRT